MSTEKTADDGTHPEIPDKKWENPFPTGHPLHELFERRIRNNQDLVILIDDYHTRRGTGKTVASLQLAEGMDQNGGVGWENVSMHPEEIRKAYASLPERSGVVLDEGEVGASNRQAMSKTNQALREIMSMGRVEEKYVIVNTPSVDFLDKDIRQLSDIWITMLAKGYGLVHFLKRQPYANGNTLLTEKQGIIQFRDIQKGTRLRKVYNKLTREKRKHIRGEEGGNSFVPEDEHKEKLEKVKKKVRKDTRDEVITKIYNHPEHQASQDISQRTLGESIGVSQQQVGNIVRDSNT